MPATLSMSILFKGYFPIYSLFTQATSVLCPVGFTIINSVFLSHFCKRKAAIITYSASHWLSTSGAACHNQFPFNNIRLTRHSPFYIKENCYYSHIEFQCILSRLTNNLNQAPCRCYFISHNHIPPFSFVTTPLTQIILSCHIMKFYILYRVLALQTF